MSDIGRWGASPNPIQRYLIGRPILAAVFGTGMLTLPLTIFVLVVTQILLLAVLHLVVMSLGLLIAIFFKSSHRTREEEFDLSALYLPWPEWMPGWVDSETLAAVEDARRSSQKLALPEGEEPTEGPLTHGN